MERGHPTHGEEMQAAFLRERLGMWVVLLKSEGFSEEEAVAFIAGVAYECCEEERWCSPANAKLTVRNLLDGHAAKFPSMRAIGKALEALKECA